MFKIKKMSRELKDNVRVPCLQNAVELQQVCQRESLKLSAATNKILLYQCLKKLGPILSQKIIKRMVETGEIEWDDDEDFEVESIKDHAIEDGVEYYLIKWRNWSNMHNTWEPKEHLDCPSLLKEFHHGRNPGSLKRKRTESDTGERQTKVSQIDDLFNRISKSQEKISPLKLLTLTTSPTKKTAERFHSLLSSGSIRRRLRRGAKVDYNNKRTKAYRVMREETQKALKEWENRLNMINADPGKITVENLVDLEGPPDNFEYINDYRAGEGITIPQDPMVGCECPNSLCIGNKKQCCGHSSGSEFAYNAYKRLRVPFGTPVYECNSRCICDADCPNRVVQHGRKFKLCIFRTANGRGWGVKTLQDIKKGSFVMEYVGEVITNEEAERRGMEYDAEGRTYLFDLDYNGDDCPFTVDAGFCGNISHFVNHSCDPNLHVFGVWINTLDPRLPRIALFAKTDIKKGEELTFDYMMTGAMGLELDRSMHEEDKENEAAPKSTEETSSGDLHDDAQPSTSSTTQNALDGEMMEMVSNEMPTDTKEDLPAVEPKLQTSSEESEKPVDRISGEDHDAATEDYKSEQTQKETDSVEKSCVSNTGSVEDAVRKIDFSPVKKSPQKVAIAKIATPPSMKYRLMCQCGAKNCRKYLF